MVKKGSELFIYSLEKKSTYFAKNSSDPFSRLFAVVGRDFRGWWRMVRARTALRAGLFTYHLHPLGGKRRIHLRIEADGSGVLLVDATDVVHLNPSAAMLVKSALDGLPKAQAVAELKRRFCGINSAEIQGHARQMYALVDHLSTTTDDCVTCRLSSVGRTTPFSRSVEAPFKADLALTYGCNNACAHCYNRVESREGPESTSKRGTLSLHEWKQVLKKLAEVGIPHIIFTGGEPTLFGGLCELIGAAERMGLITGLNTNGRRLADRAFVDSLHHAGLSHVQITLESCRPEVHNAMTGAESFAETCQGIISAIDARLHVITNTTLTRRNVDHALDTVSFLHGLGLRSFAMNGMIFSGRGLLNGDAVAVEELACVLAAVRDRARALNMRFLWYTPTDYCRLSPLELELGPRRCNAGEYSICIEPNGDVLPCQSYYVAAGNILRDPWRRIWRSELFRGFRDRVRNPRASGLPEQCWQCPDLPICGGGCRLERMRDKR